MPTSERDDTVALTAAVLVGAALCYAFMAAKLPQSLFGPMLFALPLALTLLWLGRLRWVGGLYFALAIAAAYYAAVMASIYVYSKVNEGFCLTCGANGESNSARAILNDQLIGAAGGMTGALLSFVAVALIGPKLREPRTLMLMAIGVLVLCLMGSLGFSGAGFGAHERLITPEGAYGGYLQGFTLFVLWQLVFGAILVVTMRRYTPRAKA